MDDSCLICDYDGTLATEGHVSSPVLAALQEIQRAGWHLILATGRILEELDLIFPELPLFERVVAENGAVVFRPDTGGEVVLADPPPKAFIDALQARHVKPLNLGRVIIGTEKPHDVHVLEVIREMGLERSLIFN